jgi:TonB-dependent starch-binding outer membrane protein SusC
MIVVIDTSSLLAMVRYYGRFDRDQIMFSFLKSKIEEGEIIIIDEVLNECKYIAKGIVVKTMPFLVNKNFQKKYKLTVKTANIIVSIVIKGTTQGTVTNADGEYSVSGLPEDATLVFSFVGMRTQEAPVNYQTTINVTMEEEVIGIEEVIAIGYGTQRKEEVTSSISKVNKEDFNQGAIVSSPMQLVQGKVAGLAIQRPYSDPNRGISIQLRGISTVSGNNNPLIIIDGIPGGNLNTIAPEEIESIDVLRDGSAAAIYGTRGTNGVIIVSTKKGRKGKPEVTYSGYLTSEIAKFPKMLSAKEYNELAQEYKNSNNSTKQAKSESMKDFGGNTDWFKEMTRQPFSQVHHISITGGNQSTTYYLCT